MSTLGPHDRLLDAADDLFYGEGIRAVGVGAIADAAATTKMTLYAHFRSKDELIGRYLERRGDRWREHLTDALAARRGGPKQKLLAVFDILGEGLQDPEFRGCPFINASAEFPDPKHPARRATDRHRRWLRELFAGLARDAKLRSPQSLADELLFLYDATMVSGYLDNDPGAAKTARRAAATLVGSREQS